MPRREATNDNLIVFTDNKTGEKLGMFYRDPSTQERQRYQNKAIIRKGNKIIMNQAQARLESGLNILTGLRDGDYERRGDDGRWIPISSNPDSPDFYPEWKTWAGKHCSDLVSLLAAQIFETPATIDNDGDDEEPVGCEETAAGK